MKQAKLPSLGYGSYPYGSDLPTFMHFVCFSHIFSQSRITHAYKFNSQSHTFSEKSLY